MGEGEIIFGVYAKVSPLGSGYVDCIGADSIGEKADVEKWALLDKMKPRSIRIQ